MQSGPRFLRLGIQMLYDALDELRWLRVPASSLLQFDSYAAH